MDRIDIIKSIRQEFAENEHLYTKEEIKLRELFRLGLQEEESYNNSLEDDESELDDYIEESDEDEE